MPKVIFWDKEKHFYKQLYEFWFEILLSCYIHFLIRKVVELWYAKNCWMLAKVDAKSDFLRQRKTFLQTVIWILIWNYYYLVISIFAIYAKIVEC